MEVLVERAWRKDIAALGGPGRVRQSIGDRGCAGDSAGVSEDDDVSG